MSTTLNKTLRLFLDSVGRRDEYEFYLDKFTSSPTPAFALLSPSRAGFEDTRASLSFDIEFLLRLELHPAIVLSGDEAGQMRDILLSDEEHRYAVCEFPDEQQDLTWAVDFAQQCRADACIAVFVATGLSESEALGRLIPEVSRRVHLMRTGGPLRNPEGEPLNYYYANRMQPDDVVEEDRETARMGAELLARHPQAHISVCSPWQLLEELFTVKGAGCLVRRGSRVLHLEEAGQIDRERILALLAESFSREPHSDAVLADVTEAFVEADYRGAMLLVPHAAGMYLSKFAVGTQARGEGLANELWREATSVHTALFWRARRDNPINHWYERRADGHHTSGQWRIFWLGIDPAQIPAVIAFCTTRADDFSAV